MSATSARNRLLQVIREQRDDATFDQILQELALGTALLGIDDTRTARGGGPSDSAWQAP